MSKVRRSEVSRREFLRLSVLTTATVVTAACAGAPAAPSETMATAVPATTDGATAVPAGPPSTYNEAPMLAEMVQAGTLPPVDDRLPESPVVIQPWEQIGQYGGTWNMVVRNTPYSHVYELLQYEPMVRYAMDGQEILPNVAESWEVDDEAMVYTFHIREGIKWSDGEPLTAEDMRFWFEDVVGNEELYPAFPVWMTAGGNRPTLEMLDDYTVRFTFEEPAPLFMRQMGYPSTKPSGPAHYLKQFHVDYADDAELGQKVTDAGFENWTSSFGSGGLGHSTGLPVVFAWDTGTRRTRKAASTCAIPTTGRSIQKGTSCPILIQVTLGGQRYIGRSTQGILRRGRIADLRSGPVPARHHGAEAERRPGQLPCHRCPNQRTQRIHSGGESEPSGSGVARDFQ